MDDDKKKDEPKVPPPEDATQKPEVDLSNEIKKGGKVSEKKK